MQQWNRELLELSSKQWEMAMKSTDNFCSEIRPKDAVDKHEEGAIESFNSGMGSSTERVNKTLECLYNRGYGKHNMTVLDIGSGNGVYTLPFSEYYKNVTSLDISNAMQNEIRRRAKEKNIQNIQYINSNWRDIDLEKAQLAKAFDLVMCNINPRGVCNFETLNKMNQASKGGCCLSTFAGRGKSNHGAALQQIILGRTLGTTGGNNIIFPFNVVYHMGGEPELSYSSINWQRELKPETAIENICFSYWRFTDITGDIRKKVSDYVYGHLEDGVYKERIENLIGIMVWDAWRIKEIYST